MIEEIKSYISIASEYLLLIFTASQWHILFLIVLCVSFMTWGIKNMLPYTGKKRDRYIIAISWILGIVAVIVAANYASKPQPMWYWFVVGAVTGPVTNILYRYTMPMIKRFAIARFPMLDSRKTQRPS
jgi:hypothetical protein